MEIFPLVLLLFFALLLGSKGKTMDRVRPNVKEVKRKIDAGQLATGSSMDFKRREVRSIEAGYNHRRVNRKNGKEDNVVSSKQLRSCFCGIPQGFTCPNGFLETQIHWNDASFAGPLVPPHFPAEGPPFDIGGEWAWLQDSYNGDPQQNAYGWNWKESFNDNLHAGPQLGIYPCNQQGWCCCGEGKPNNKASDAVKPVSKPNQHKQKSSDRIIINIARSIENLDKFAGRGEDKSNDEAADDEEDETSRQKKIENKMTV